MVIVSGNVEESFRKKCFSLHSDVHIVFQVSRLAICCLDNLGNTAFTESLSFVFIILNLSGTLVIVNAYGSVIYFRLESNLFGVWISWCSSKHVRLFRPARVKIRRWKGYLEARCLAWVFEHLKFCHSVLLIWYYPDVFLHSVWLGSILHFKLARDCFGQRKWILGEG